MNHSEVAKVIGILRARYPRAEWGPNDELTVEAWHMSLGDLPLEPVLGALRAMFNESPFAPDPSEIRAHILAEAGVVPEPGEAWRHALAGISAYYPGQSSGFVWIPAVKHAVNQIGGVHMLKMSEDPERDRDAFMRVYAVERKRALAQPGLGVFALPGGAGLKELA